MNCFLEKWSVLDVKRGGVVTRYDVVDGAGIRVFTPAVDLGIAGREYARRIVACVNAMRGQKTERIERMALLNPPNWWLPVYEGLPEEGLRGPLCTCGHSEDAHDFKYGCWCETSPDICCECKKFVAATTPERVIEYEVEGHPWACEEGCEHPAAAARRISHEQAAADWAARKTFTFGEAAL